MTEVIITLQNLRFRWPNQETDMLYLPELIVKKGEHGAVLFHEDGMFALPAYPVTQLHDPTGAGDSFAGALIGRLASRNRSDFSAIKEAMLYATCTASLTVEAFGCDRLESAGKAVIEERVESLKQLISFT